MSTGSETEIYSGHPSWRSMLDFHLAGLVIAAAGGAIARLATSKWGLAVAVFAAILALSLLIGFIRRLATHYTITDRRLHIRTGILSRTEQHTTIDRVQDVETHQTLLERVLGIGTVNFNTAATEESEFRFEGVASPRTVVAAVDRAQHAAATLASSSGGSPATSRDQPSTG
jgi:uncharacterized membrane protein YdbT with pleckstrin-like domain